MKYMILSGLYTVTRILAISGICTALIKAKSLNSIFYWIGVGFLIAGDVIDYFLRKEDHNKFHVNKS